MAVLRGRGPPLPGQSGQSQRRAHRPHAVQAQGGGPGPGLSARWHSRTGRPVPRCAAESLPPRRAAGRRTLQPGPAGITRKLDSSRIGSDNHSITRLGAAMHIVADENIPLLDEFLGEFGRLTRLPGRLIDHTSIADADVLLVRSVTRVSAEMLAGTPVRFVGTCTIGTDHLDLAGLDAAGIEVASAPGCNARGVVEYVLSCLLTFAERSASRWQDRVVGIVGVGEVGSRLATVLQALGVKTLLCDPPRAERGEPGFAD